MPTKKAPRSSRPHMPGYGIPQGKKGLLPWKWAKERLQKSHNYWISTVRPDGSPHTMIVWGLWLDGAFLFSTGNESRKARNLALNPRCVIGTEKANEAVVVEGLAETTTDARLCKKFATLYQKKYNFDMSSFTEPIYVVHPRIAFGLSEKDFMGKATRWQF
jgi:Pyridoxamine 5'-phosphate oxidase